MDTNEGNTIERIAELFCKYGVKSVSMDDIARELGISKKTIYQYVKDKEELIEKTVNHVKSKHMNMIAEIAARGLNAIEEVFETMTVVREAISNVNPIIEFEMRKYYPNLHRRLNERHSNIAREIMTRNLHKGIREGLFRDNFNPEFIAFLHYGRVMELIALDPALLPLPWPEAINQALEYHLRGICTERGMEVLNLNFKKTHQQ